MSNRAKKSAVSMTASFSALFIINVIKFARKTLNHL